MLPNPYPPLEDEAPGPSSKFVAALRKATATFVFASIGVLSVTSIFDNDANQAISAAGVGAGAVLNLIYRWGERVQREGNPT